MAEAEGERDGRKEFSTGPRARPTRPPSPGATGALCALGGSPFASVPMTVIRATNTRPRVFRGVRAPDGETTHQFLLDSITQGSGNHLGKERLCGRKQPHQKKV